MKYDLVKPRPNGPYSLYCFSCNNWVPNTANAEMKKDGYYSHNHFCVDGVIRTNNGEIKSDSHDALEYLIKTGYRQGLVKIVESPNNDGVVCQIGECWFYFGGQTAEEMSAEEYIKNVPKDDIVNEIIEVLKDFSRDEGFKDEFEYYVSFLGEKIF